MDILIDEGFSRTIKKNRIWEIDFLRGFLILFMVVDHLMYDFGYVIRSITDYNVSTSPSWIIDLVDNSRWYWIMELRENFRLFVLATFLFLSGISCYFSRNNLKRGLQITAVGMLIFIVTFSFYEITGFDFRIFFGAIFCFGVCILLAHFAKRVYLSKKVRLESIFVLLILLLAISSPILSTAYKELQPSLSAISIFIIILIIYSLFCQILDILCISKSQYWKYLSLLMGVVIVCYSLANGMLKSPFVSQVNLSNWFLIVIGFLDSTQDWLGILPSLGYLFIGIFFGECLYKDRKSAFPLNDGKWNKPISFVGRHTFIVYLFHQVILIPIVIIISLIAGLSINI